MLTEKQNEKIIQIRTRIKTASNTAKTSLMREWYRNVLFFSGKQWISWDSGQRRWREVATEKWYPKPVTNKFASVANTIISVLTQKEPRVIVSPSSDSDEDVAASEIGDAVVEVSTKEAKLADARRVAAAWNVITGNVFFHTFPYSDKELGTTFIPFWRCNQCAKMLEPDQVSAEAPACPECGGDIGEAVDQNGKKMGVEMPRTELRTEVVSPFEISFDQEITSFQEARQVVRTKRKPTEELKAIFKDHADKIVPEGEGASNDNTGMMYTESLAYLSGGTLGRNSLTTSGSDKQEMSTIDYVYSLPCDGFEEGFAATIVGDIIVESSTLWMFTDKDGHYYNPIKHCVAQDVPGRVWGKSPLDDVARKQIDRNKLESFLQLGIYTMSSSKWIAATNQNMTKPTGEYGQILEYTPQKDVPPPQIISGSGPRIDILQFIEQIDRDIEDLGATLDVLKGQLPQGLDTFSGLRLLTERAYSRHGKMIEWWEVCNEKVTIQLVELARKFFTEQRKKTYQTDFGTWETKVFTKADFQGGIDIRVERGSTIPQSRAVENAGIFDSIKSGLIDPSDPMTKKKILEKLGQSELDGPVGADIKDAMREWKSFLDAVMENPDRPEAWMAALRPRKGIDNEQIHYMDAVSRAKSEEYFALPEAARKVWEQHIAYHLLNLKLQMAAQVPKSAEPVAA